MSHNEAENGPFLRYHSYQDGCFQLTSNDENDIRIETPLSLQTGLDPNNYSLHRLAKEDVKENDICEVFLRVEKQKVRAGWLIPLNALSSDQHERADDEHFLTSAYIVARKALTSYGTRELGVDQGSSPFTFDKLFDENTVFLLLFNEATEKADNYRLERTLPDLARYGYFIHNELIDGKPTFKSALVIPKRLTLCLTSTDVEGLDVICKVLNPSFSLSSESLLSFFFLYQIIEILIEQVYQDELKRIAIKLIFHKNDIEATKRILDDSRDSQKDKNRLNLLFGRYLHTKVDCEALFATCNDFLLAQGWREGNSFSSCLYPVRNFLFHRYRDISPDSSALLANIVTHLMDVVVEVLASFSLVEQDDEQVTDSVTQSS